MRQHQKIFISYFVSNPDSFVESVEKAIYQYNEEESNPYSRKVKAIFAQGHQFDQHETPDYFGYLRCFLEKIPSLSSPSWDFYQSIRNLFNENFMKVVDDFFNTNPSEERASEVLRAGQELSDMGWLIPETFDAVARHPKPWELASAFIDLADSDIIQNDPLKIGEILQKSAHPEVAAELVRELYFLPYKVLQQENFASLKSEGREEISVKSFLKSKLLPLLTEENIELIANHPKPDELKKALKYFNSFGFGTLAVLTPLNLSIIAKSTDATSTALNMVSGKRSSASTAPHSTAFGGSLIQQLESLFPDSDNEEQDKNRNSLN